MTATMRRQWWPGLTAILAIFYLAIGASASGTIAAAAILGVVLIGLTLAMRTRSKPAAIVLLVIGTVPLGIITWWSLITPILALLVLLCGSLAIRAAAPPTAFA